MRAKEKERHRERERGARLSSTNVSYKISRETERERILFVMGERAR